MKRNLKFLRAFGLLLVCFVAAVAAMCFAACFEEEPAPVVKYYDVNVECGTGGYCSLNGERFAEGSTVVLTIIADGGYEISELLKDGMDVTESVQNGQYSFEISADTAFKITFAAITPPSQEPQKHSVNVSCGTGGSYSLSPAAEDGYEHGTEVTLTVTPNAGYRTSTVTINGEIAVLTASKCTFKALSDTEIVVVFAELHYNVNVSCGAGGSYSLSPTSENGYTYGTEVTLTVTPNAGYRASSVTINGEIAALTENECTFETFSDTEIVITFAEQRYNVNVSCGADGGFSLSPTSENGYAYGTDVTLTVTPNSGYSISSVTINGEEAVLTEGECTFKTLSDINIVISFSPLEGIFSSDYVGEWHTSISGAAPSIISITETTFTFEDSEYPVTPAQGGFEFSVTDEEGATINYSMNLLPADGGKYLLTLEYSQVEGSGTELFTVYYFKNNVDYFTHAMPESIVAEYKVNSGRSQPIIIDENHITVGISYAAIISANDSTYEYSLLVDGVMRASILVQVSLSQLVYTTEDGTTYYSKQVAMRPTLVPQYAGVYTSPDGSHSVVVSETGEFRFDDVVYDLIPGDASGAQNNLFTLTVDGKQYSVEFFSGGTYLWLHYGYNEAYSFYMYNKFPFFVNCGDHGSYTISPEDGKAGLGESVTITVTADEGYVIDAVQMKSGGGYTTDYIIHEGTTTWTQTYQVTENRFDSGKTGNTLVVTFKPAE